MMFNKCFNFAHGRYWCCYRALQLTLNQWVPSMHLAASLPTIPWLLLVSETLALLLFRGD